LKEDEVFLGGEQVRCPAEFLEVEEEAEAYFEVSRERDPNSFSEESFKVL